MTNNSETIDLARGAVCCVSKDGDVGSVLVPLAGVVSISTGELITSDDLFRSYSSVISTKTKVGGRVSATNNVVIYRVGRNGSSGPDVMEKIKIANKHERIAHGCLDFRL